MVNAQEWLDENYPKEGRDLLVSLDIKGRELKGSLQLERFTNLEELNCSYNQITDLDLNDCRSLRKLDCSFNYLTSVDFLSSIPFPQKLEVLMPGENNIIDTTLDIFKRFENLERLWMGTFDNERTRKGIYNRFYGSLEPLKNLTKLKQLGISHTSVEKGLEHLPASLEKIWCYPNNGQYDTKVSKLVEVLKDYRIKQERYTWYDYQAWRQSNFLDKKENEFDNIKANFVKELNKLLVETKSNLKVCQMQCYQLQSENNQLEVDSKRLSNSNILSQIKEQIIKTKQTIQEKQKKVEELRKKIDNLELQKYQQLQTNIEIPPKK